jgi:hypothetical protein
MAICGSNVDGSFSVDLGQGMKSCVRAGSRDIGGSIPIDDQHESANDGQRIELTKALSDTHLSLLAGSTFLFMTSRSMQA